MTRGRRRPVRPAAAALAGVLVALLAGLLTAGCGGSSSGPTDEDPPAAGDGAPLVSLVRTGGIAGLRDEVQVSPSGQVTVTGDRSPTSTTATMAPADLARLRTALARSGFATLESDYLDRSAADAYQYAVTYQGRTVTADEGVVPEGLRPVIDQLVGLLA